MNTHTQMCLHGDSKDGQVDIDNEHHRSLLRAQRPYKKLKGQGPDTQGNAMKTKAEPRVTHAKNQEAGRHKDPCSLAFGETVALPC